MSEQNCRCEGADAIRDIVVFICGFAAGAMVALLYAPKSGEETRRELAEKYDDLRDQARDLGEDLLDKVEEARELLSRQIESGTALVGEKRQAILEGITALQAKINVAKSRWAGTEKEQ